MASDLAFNLPANETIPPTMDSRGARGGLQDRGRQRSIARLSLFRDDVAATIAKALTLDEACGRYPRSVLGEAIRTP